MSRSTLFKSISIIAGFLLLASYQNCGKVSFASKEGTLVAKDDSNDSGNTGLGDSGTGDSGGSGGTDSGGSDSGDGDSSSSDDPNSTDNNDPNNPNDPYTPGDTAEDDDSDDDNGYTGGPGNSGNTPGKNAGSKNSGGNCGYICILEGPGSSVRLGLDRSSGSMKTNGQTPDTVCMSASACTDIVSQAFSVKFAAKRGFCKSPGGNPHVIHLTDEEISLKLAEQNDD